MVKVYSLLIEIRYSIGLALKLYAALKIFEDIPRYKVYDKESQKYNHKKNSLSHCFKACDRTAAQNTLPCTSGLASYL